MSVEMQYLKAALYLLCARDVNTSNVCTQPTTGKDNLQTRS